MRFLKGWCGAKGWCDNPSGSRPNSFGRQHLTFDKGGKDIVLFEGKCGFGRVGKALSPLAPLCKGELLLQCEALPTIEGLLTEVSEKRKGCGRKAIPPVVARILSGDSTSPLTREARMWCGARDSAVFERLVRSERLV